MVFSLSFSLENRRMDWKKNCCFGIFQEHWLSHLMKNRVFFFSIDLLFLFYFLSLQWHVLLFSSYLLSLCACRSIVVFVNIASLQSNSKWKRIWSDKDCSCFAVFVALKVVSLCFLGLLISIIRKFLVSFLFRLFSEQPDCNCEVLVHFRLDILLFSLLWLLGVYWRGWFGYISKVVKLVKKVDVSRPILFIFHLWLCIEGK